MMRCVQCGRDYPERQAFCHQCGEPLQPREGPVEAPVPGTRAQATLGRSRAISRRRAPARSQSLLFVVLVLLGAATGLALVWRHAWMPSLPRVTLSLSRQPEAPPRSAGSPSQAPAAAPVETQPAAPAPPPAAPAPEPAETAPPPPVVTRAPEPVPATAASPPAKRVPEPAPRLASRPEPPPASDRPPVGAASRQPPATAPRLLSARTDPGTSLPTGAWRVIALVPVGSATGARGQIVWEPIGGGTLVVSGLPQPPAGRTYQLWLGSVDLGNRVSAGLLAVDSQGAGTLRVAPPRATWAPDIFGITMERQGGAREPSDDLVLVGEISKLSVAAPPVVTAPGAPSPERPGAGASPPGAETPSPSASSPPVTAAIPPAAPARGPDGQLVRVFPVTVGRTWMVAQSVLRSLGWDIDRADQATGVIRTEPRNVTFKDFVVYAEGTRHTLDVVVRAVSGSETSISVKREVFEEQRIFWTKERKVLATPESSVEQAVLDAIERLL